MTTSDPWRCQYGHPTTPPVEYRGAEYRFCPACEDRAQDAAGVGEYHEGGIIVAVPEVGYASTVGYRSRGAAQDLEDVAPTCDICGRPEDQDPTNGREYDWNGETGNHLTCEAR